MSIQASEMLWRYPTERSDAASNGGRMTKDEIIHATKNSIWPDIPQSERTAGSTKYRKAFIHIANDDDISLVNPRVFVETPSPGEDNITIFPGTMVDTQATMNETGGLFGCGWLNDDTNIGVDANSIEVMTEDAALDIFRDGETIRISDKADVDSVGNEAYVTIDVAGVSYIGDVATITFTPAITVDFLASNTRVASVIEPADIEATYSSFVDTTAGDGVYDDTGGNLTLDSIGTIEQEWTITFTSASEFNITGSPSGFSGSGNTSGNAVPDNPDFSKPYFTLDNSGFSGTWAQDDTITFTTSPAATAIWYKREVPTDCNSYSGDKVICAIDGESA